MMNKLFQQAVDEVRPTLDGSRAFSSRRYTKFRNECINGFMRLSNSTISETTDYLNTNWDFIETQTKLGFYERN